MKVMIQDNGVTPARNLTSSELLRNRHFGVVGMQAWARSVGGELAMQSSENGTTVWFVSPVELS